MTDDKEQEEQGSDPISSKPDEEVVDADSPELPPAVRVPRRAQTEDPIVEEAAADDKLAATDDELLPWNPDEDGSPDFMLAQEAPDVSSPAPSVVLPPPP